LSPSSCGWNKCPQSPASQGHYMRLANSAGTVRSVSANVGSDTYPLLATTRTHVSPIFPHPSSHCTETQADTPILHASNRV